MVELLAANSILLLFVVAAGGYLLGRIRVGGASLGVAGVLFVGLGVGAIDPRLELPEIVYMIGLVMFVYTVGLSSGPGFFASLRGRGLRYNLLALSMLVLAAALVFGGYLLGIGGPQAAGVFAGSLTNTPALAAVVEYLQREGAHGAALSDPVVGYSLAYPVSVLGMILTIYFAQRLWKIDYEAERNRPDLAGAGGGALPIESVTVKVSSGPHAGVAVRDLMARTGWDVVLSRVRHNGRVELVNEGTRLQAGDLVTVVGTPQEVARVVEDLGVVSDEQLQLDRTDLDFRRLFVSNPDVAGRRLRDLALLERYGALVSRLRRGDVEMVPHGDTVLELGDRVRVTAAPENLPAVTRFFGDSYKAVSEIDMLSFSLGVAAGVLLGMVPIPLPGGITIKLGLAGGPLVVALILGARERTGPIVWNMPYSANLMLRQVGLVLFLAGVGTRAGYDFYTTVASGQGTLALVTAVVIVVVVGLATLFLGRKLLRMPMGLLTGMLAGVQTQPATLAFALEQSRDDYPNIGYATVFPFAVIGKIVLAQLLLVLMGV